MWLLRFVPLAMSSVVILNSLWPARVRSGNSAFSFRLRRTMLGCTL